MIYNFFCQMSTSMIPEWIYEFENVGTLCGVSQNAIEMVSECECKMIAFIT